MDAEPERFEPAPTASLADVVQPVLDAPRDSRQVGDGETFSIFAPAEFQQSERAGPGGVSMLVLQGPADDPGSAVAPVADFESSGVFDVLRSLSVERV